LLPALTARAVGYHVSSFVDRDHVEPYPELDRYTMLIVMGSHESAYDNNLAWLSIELDFVASAIRLRIPVLGICFGGQLLTRALGGSVTPSRHPERGFTRMNPTTTNSCRKDRGCRSTKTPFTVPATAHEIPAMTRRHNHLPTESISVCSFIPRSPATASKAGSKVEHSHTSPNKASTSTRCAQTSLAEHPPSVRACDQLLGTFYTRTHVLAS